MKPAKNEPYVTLTDRGKVEFSVLSQKVQRLEGRTKLLSRQVELLCTILLDYITTERTKTALAQIQNLQEMSRRHERADMNGGD